MKKVSYIIGNTGNINLVIGNKSHTVAVDHVNYKEIIEKLNAEDYEGIEGLLDIAGSIAVASEGEVVVLDGSICYKGKEVINALTDRILRFVKEGLPFKPMLRFLKNLMSNVSRTAVQELFLFLESNQLPITEDGCFLAYRKVDNEYMSYHPNPDGTKNRNMVGDVLTQERNEVDDVRDNVCSNGLHFCSLAYVPKYHGGNGRVMIVKINPADVVSIPSDYNNSKGRCCKYEVVAEHTDPNKEYKEYTESALMGADGGEMEGEACSECGCDMDECICEFCPECGELLDGCTCFDEDEEGECDCGACNCNSHSHSNLGQKPNGQNYHNVRDSHGKFVKRG